MRGANQLRVLIADDHDGFRHELREALERNLDIVVVEAVSNGVDAVRRASALRPDGLDLVLIDIDMPAMDGIRATRELVARDPGLPIIILTVSMLERDLYAGMAAGAVGFLNKNISPGSLVRTLRDFQASGSLPMSRVMAGKVITHLRQQHAELSAGSAREAENLSARERKILTEIAAGARDREIARTLFVAETTIKTHVRHILRKLGARNRTEAVARMRDR